MKGRLAARGFTRPAVSWALYDFANTIFSYAVVTRYYNEWIIEQRGNPDWVVGAMGAVVSAVLVLTLPVLGALADRRGWRKRFVVASTLVCASATLALAGVTSTGLALVVGGVAILGFTSALAHYDPLLAHVAPPHLQGRISGLGVGLGYVSVLIALPVLGAAVGEGGDNQRAFAPTAVLLLVFALPLFLFVHEDRPAPGAAGGAGARRAVTEGVGELRGALALVRGRAVGRLLVARFLYVDALATVIAYMTIYARRVGGLSGSQLDLLLALSIVFAAAGAFLAGRAVERVGPKRVLTAVLAALVLALLTEAASGSVVLLWLLGPVVGVALGAVWTADRVLMLRLSEPAERGRVFSLYALAGRLSSGVGPLVLWGGVIWLLDDATGLLGAAGASRVALAALAAAALGGLALLRPIDDRAPAALARA